MQKQVVVSCPMDCFDLCRFKVTVENNRVVGLVGDPYHPLTRGVVCRKGKKLIEQLVHPGRLQHPLMKKGNAFVEISYDQVFDLLAKKLSAIKDRYGNTAILNYTSDGYGGCKNRIQSS